MFSVGSQDGLEGRQKCGISKVQICTIFWEPVARFSPSLWHTGRSELIGVNAGSC